MPVITLMTRDGKAVTIDAAAGRSLMENLRDSGQSGLIAMCGGCCACATCHVYIPETWRSITGSPDGAEQEMTQSSPHYQAGSRLSCQIVVTDALDGLHVAIAPED
jgi:ferredoxin, 2Fe-2S